MKIAMADSCALKFSRDLKEHWEAKGHEVRYEIGASEHLAQWSDLYYIDWCDNNVNYLYKIYTGIHPEHLNWKEYHRPKFIARAIDWEVWLGFARDQNLVDFIDQWICIAPHIEKKLKSEANYRPGQLICIPPGVNLDQFTSKTKQTDGFQLGMVLGDMWWPKAHMTGLDIFTTLYKKDHRWKLHLRGQHERGEYWPVMYEHYLDSRNIREAVILYPQVEFMNDWYENIDILLHPGMKESFCYAIGEAMAKGIRPVINEFYGAREIWRHEDLYQTHEEAVQKILHPVDPKDPRHYIETAHNLKDMLVAFDKLLGT